MKAIVNAIQRALEFLHSWVVKGFTFAHTEWAIPWAERVFAGLKKITFIYAAIVVLIGMWLTAARDYGAMMLEAAVEVGKITTEADTVFSQMPTVLIMNSAYGIANYVFPVNELFTLLIFFVGFKSVSAVMRVLVKIYELLPFKMS